MSTCTVLIGIVYLDCDFVLFLPIDNFLCYKEMANLRLRKGYKPWGLVLLVIFIDIVYVEFGLETS